jgi:hypothetical protein
MKTPQTTQARAFADQLAGARVEAARTGKAFAAACSSRKTSHRDLARLADQVLSAAGQVQGLAALCQRFPVEA